LNDGEYQEGSRDTIQRLKLMGLDKNDFFGATVLDIGCNLGSICIEADIHGAKYVAGIDYEQDYIDCARDLAKHNDCKINFTVGDLTDTEQTIKYIERIFPMEIDILFALSVYKHIGNCLWIILDRIDWKVAYIESHNAPDGEETDHVKQMIIGMDSLEGVKREFVCQTNDRSPRLVWRLTR
jgi:SAM-dependent methyltransferase